ncbi:MAG: RNA methyltransferase [Alphaproteobacteria bacterium]|nr:RNA methyltransferase [Alphaproteobacteria bacterium]
MSFQGPPTLGPRVCLWSRVATRVFEELQRGRIHSADDLYTVASRVPWDRYIRPDQTLAVAARTTGTTVKDARYASLKVKDAVVDQLREATGSRPDVDTEDPVLPLRVTVKGKVATISRDLAGSSLHKRGYRPAQHASPLNEALAAGLLLLSDWDRTSPVCDPMCGSATFLIEAAFIIGDRAPGLGRTFAFERWTDLDRADWEAAKADARARWAVGKTRVPMLHGNDLHPGSLGLARKAAGRAEVSHLLALTEGDITAFAPPQPVPFVVTNPPYGARIGEGDDLVRSWVELGRWLKDRAPGATAWVLSGDPGLSKHLRLRTSGRVPIHNGPIDCRWLRYDLRPREAPEGP